jgi:cell division protein FtsW (lipid II flippase)
VAGARQRIDQRASAVRRGVWRAGIRPRARQRELGLLLLVGFTLFIGWMSLASLRAGKVTPGDFSPLLSYAAVLGAIHVVFVVTGRRMDQILLPAVAMLGGLSLLLMERLPQDLVVQRILGARLDLAPLQLMWLCVSLVLMALIAVLVRQDGWLRYYRYSWAAAGIGLLLLVFVLGDEVNGARLSLTIGPFTGQPSELLKVILVVFLAAYLADNRQLLAGQSWRVGPVSLPPLQYLLPMLGMWGIAMAVVIFQSDLGAALLFFSVFLGLLYVATRRVSFVLVGLALFALGSVLLFELVGRVHTRVDVWLDPFADPLGAGYQVIRGLYAFGRGGVLGTGLGAGLPQVGSIPAIPAIHTDFVFAALGEELGLVGALAICALYLLIAARGFHIAARAGDEFQALLATGLTLVIVLQAALIIGGNLKLVPLTGITLPFISYGGSSLLANAIVVGLLLALSDRGLGRVLPPPLRHARAAPPPQQPLPQEPLPPARDVEPDSDFDSELDFDPDSDFDPEFGPTGEPWNEVEP